MASFAPRGHAKLNPQSPRAFAICERCGFLYNHADLQWDMQYQGRELRRTGFLVCSSCNDVPNPTLRPIVLPADPVPILNPRAEPVHCHTFKPRGDADVPYPTPINREARADVKYDHFPPVDVFKDVTVDRSSVCDTRTNLKWPNLRPDPPPIPIPPQPPVDEGDATTDNTNITADATGTTADAFKPYIPLEGFFAVADTTQIDADNMVNSTDSFPDYDQAADIDDETADTTAVKGDSQQLSG